MEKPTVFFSHSSKDKEYVLELKKLIMEKTSDTIEMFQSSDGESIPFGKNWVYRVEEKLSSAKIMFVFISPNSMKSNWIYFEAGFSYSKGIRVIPVGILGIDIGQIHAPLNLLQGFNIRNHEGLNNIIAILNNEFNCKYKTDFSQLQFDLLQNKTNLVEQLDDNILNKIDYFKTEFSSQLQDNTLIGNAFEVFKEYLLTHKIQNSTSNQYGDNRLYLYGMEVRQHNDGREEKLRFDMDLLRLDESLQIISGILPLIYENPIERYYLQVYFGEEIKLITTNYKLSARLNEFEIQMSDINGDLYMYKNMLFALDEPRHDEKNQSLRIIYNPNKPDVNEIMGLLKFLFSIGVIYH